MYVNVYIHKAAATMNSDERAQERLSSHDLARSAIPPVSARLDALHENHFGSHERQLQRDVGLYHRRPHMQAIYHCNPRGVKKGDEDPITHSYYILPHRDGQGQTNSYLRY